ncbi:hypothetical protein Tco_1465949 [Tanacetum coccineum]
MATLNEPIPQGTGSSSGPRHQDTILGDRPAQTRFERLSKQSNEPPLSRVNILGSGEDNMKLNEFMEICTKLSERVLDLENVKNAQALEIQKLKKRVKKLEIKKKSRTPQLKRRLFKRLQVELDEEARLEREREERASKAANIAEWDGVQAIMDADYELAAKLQAEEISIEERSKLFVELMNERKKHFAKQKSREENH